MSTEIMSFRRDELLESPAGDISGSLLGIAGWQLLSVCNQAVGWIVGGKADGYPVTQDHPDVKLPHPPRKFCGYVLAGIQFHDEVASGQDILDNTLNLYEIVSRQSFLQ